jgi:predicted DNA binding CopG/RHH family protein
MPTIVGMERNNIIRVRLSDLELQALKKHAASKEIPMSEAVRDWVKTLVKKIKE